MPDNRRIETRTLFNEWQEINSKLLTQIEKQDEIITKQQEIITTLEGGIDTRVTGSNVEYGSFTNITISASESYRINRFKPIFKTVILTVRGGDPSVKVVDSLSVRAGFYHTEGGSPFVFAKGVANGEAGDSIIYATYAINVVSPEMVIDLTNKTDADLTIERMSVLGVE